MSSTLAWRHPWLSVFAVALCLFAGARARLWAQPAPSSSSTAAVIDLDHAREPVTRVSTVWKFHAGDDPHWSAPDFDDSAWKTLNPEEDWKAQGLAAEKGTVWFRFRLQVAPGTPDLVLTMPRLMKNYQLFAGGRQVGQVGALPPAKGGLASGAMRVFTLPLSDPGSPSTLVVALRFWRPEEFAFTSRDVLTSAVLVGTSSAMLPMFDRDKAANLVQRNGMDYTTTLIQLPIMAATLLLFWLTRERFYLWFGINMLTGAADLATRLLANHFALDFRTSLFAYILSDFVASTAIALFLVGYLALRDRRLVWLSILLFALSQFGPILVVFHLPALWGDGIYLVLNGAGQILLAWLVVRAWRSGSVEAGLFLIPFALTTGEAVLTNLGYTLIELHVPGVLSWLPTEHILLDAPFNINLTDLSSFVALFGFLAVLVVRFWRTIRDQQRLASALRAAHEIQGKLVPESVLQYRNLRTEVIYIAAEEVGGDFCQVLPRADGSLLAVIGDVSGKGLQAAMIGALAVGALRSLVHDVFDPAIVLERMNEVMLRSDLQGFVTCLCVEIQPDGTMITASAGHPPPYINGVEAECEPGLPLGLVAEASYGQSLQVLPPEARLTLLSDGVLEARSPTGELFGFTRMQEISNRPASEIAAAAQTFGQQDDITVMTLDWTATFVPA